MDRQSASTLLLARMPPDRPGRVARRAVPRAGRGAVHRLGVPGARGSGRRMIDLFDDPLGFLSRLILQIPALLVAVTVHELAHALVADQLGDPTPRRLGRITLNPLPHIDPLGALAFVLAGFGWAKPVPVSAQYLRRPIRDMALVAAAGPLSNFLVAFVAPVAVGMPPHGGGRVR